MKALFLDRDGVINVENSNGYILHQEDFEFMDGVLEAIAILKNHFDVILVATNQRCVGRGMISTADLESMHRYMQEMVLINGGEIHQVFYAPAKESDDYYRKPNVGMAHLAKEQFPFIDFEQSVMVGNNLSDMQFGKTMGMHTVFLATTSAAHDLPHSLIDLQFDSLLDYALHISKKN